MTKSAKYVHALLLSSVGDLVGTQGTRRQRSARHVASWKMSARSACWILNMVYQFRSGIQHLLLIPMMPFQGVMSIVSILQKSTIEGYVLFFHHWNLMLFSYFHNAWIQIQILYFLGSLFIYCTVIVCIQYCFHDDTIVDVPACTCEILRWRHLKYDIKTMPFL